MTGSRVKKAACLLIISVCISGCGTAVPVTEASDSITLVEPVNTAADTEMAQMRDLYDYKVVSGSIYPMIKEYAFSEDCVLLSYEVAPGDLVKEGSVLAVADDTLVQQQIEGLENQIEQETRNYGYSQEDFADTILDLEKQISELTSDKKKLEEEKVPIEKELERIGDAINRLNLSQEETAAQQIGELNERRVQVTAQNYAIGEQIKGIGNQITSLSNQLEKVKLNQAHAVSLYEMDCSFRDKTLADLKESKKKYQLCSDMSGVVVSVGGLMPNTWVSTDRNIVAVADYDTKVLKCEYVSKSDAAKCEDMYAFISGKRYEVTYQPIEREEYDRLSADGNTVYSTFLIEDPEDELEIGDFAVLAEIYSADEDVLSVSRNAIHKDASGTYVYQMIDGVRTTVTVKTGQSDGVYTEIVSGLSLGDTVLLTENTNYGNQTATVEMGTFSNKFQGQGYMSYPATEMLSCEVEHGTAYFVQYETSLYATVQAGDVIATITVTKDEASLYEKTQSLARAEQRLIEEQQKEKPNERTISERTREIAALREEIAEIQADYATTAIRANTNGIVVYLAQIEENAILEKDTVVAMVADENKCYLSVDNSNGQLNLGDVLSIDYTDASGTKKTVEGMVAAASAQGMSSELVTEDTYLLLPSEATKEMSAVTATESNNFWNRASYDVYGAIREMDHVLIVPRNAVKQINGKMYVYVIEDDGSIKAQSFIAGGYDTTGYWVIDGLEEGMKLCSE